MKNGMEKIEIYKFQLEAMVEALRLTYNIHNSQEGKTCHSRCVKEALQYGQNALIGKIDEKVKYI